jgi:hypothetical protein
MPSKMDPLSITATVVTLTARCISTAKSLYNLHSQFKHAHLTISAIYSESTIISASLGHVQNLVLTKPEAFGERPELGGILDTALTGVMLVFSVLGDEVQELMGVGGDGHEGSGSLGRELGKRKAMKVVWKEDVMRELLVQIRGQQTALTLLIQALQL